MNVQRTHDRGFTLIELMITVAIVAILVAIAYPSFINYMQRGYRGEGKRAAEVTVQMEERFFNTTGAYVNQASGVPVPAAGLSGFSCESAVTATCRYRVGVVVTPPGAVFTVTVTPQGWTDSQCQSLTLTSTGVRGTTGGTLPAADCWR